MRFLIAGLGSIGRRHLRNLVALGERDIVLFRTGKSTLPDADLEGYPVDYDLDAALGRNPTAVIVANPTALHLDVAIPAAQAGCHLLIEKPVSHSMERVADLQRAVERGGGRVLIGYQYRFHPSLRQAAEWLRSGKLGRIVSATAEYGEFLPGWHPWEDYRAGYSARVDLGGGAILTLSHIVDSLLWLLGPGKLLAVRSQIVPELAPEAESAATLFMAFQGGTTGVATMDYLRRPKVHRMEFVGTHGTATWNEATGNADLLLNRLSAEESAPLPSGYDRNDLFVAELAHFVRVARGEDEPACTLEDGLRTLQLLVQAKEMASFRSAGQEPSDRGEGAPE